MQFLLFFDSKMVNVLSIRYMYCLPVWLSSSVNGRANVICLVKTLHLLDNPIWHSNGKLQIIIRMCLTVCLSVWACVFIWMRKMYNNGRRAKETDFHHFNNVHIRSDRREKNNIMWVSSFLLDHKPSDGIQCISTDVMLLLLGWDLL